MSGPIWSYDQQPGRTVEQEALLGLKKLYHQPSPLIHSMLFFACANERCWWADLYTKIGFLDSSSSVIFTLETWLKYWSSRLTLGNKTNKLISFNYWRPSSAIFVRLCYLFICLLREQNILGEVYWISYLLCLLKSHSCTQNQMNHPWITWVLSISTCSSLSSGMAPLFRQLERGLPSQIPITLIWRVELTRNWQKQKKQYGKYLSVVHSLCTKIFDAFIYVFLSHTYADS